MTREVNYTYKAILLVNLLQLISLLFGYGGRMPVFDVYEKLGNVVYDSNNVQLLRLLMLKLVYATGEAWGGKLLVIINISGAVAGLNLLCDSFNINKKHKYLIIAVLLTYLPFIKLLSEGDLYGLYIGILSLAICATERIWLRSMWLVLACLLNGKTIFIVIFMAFSGALNIAIISSVCLSILALIYFPLVENIFRFDWSSLLFSFNNNASFIGFPAYIYSMIYNKDGELFYSAMIDGKYVGYKLFASLILTILTCEIIRVKNCQKLFDAKDTQIAHILLFVPLVVLYPHWVPIYELSVIILMLPLLAYLYERKIACKACLYGFGGFVIVAGLGITRFIPMLREFNMLSCFMMGIWIAAINIREYKKNIY